MKMKYFIMLMRSGLKDMDGTKFSDYDIRFRMNEVLLSIFTKLGLMNNNILTVSTSIPMIDGIGDMPQDFLSLLQISDSGRPLSPSPQAIDDVDKKVNNGYYCIMDKKIYAVCDSVYMLYRKGFTPITGETEDFPLPEYFADTVRRHTVSLLTGSEIDDAALQADVYNIAAVSGYTNMEIDPAWRIS